MKNYRSWSHQCHVIFPYIGKAIFSAAGYAFILCILLLSLYLMTGKALAQISQLSDENLSGISGQAGVSINLNTATEVHLDVVKFSDTALYPNWIELYDVKVGDGAGGGFRSATWDMNPVAGVTNFLTYYSGSTNPLDPYYNANADPVKAAYTWLTDKMAILNDANVLNGTITGFEQALVDPITLDVATSDGSANMPPSGTTFVSVRNTSNRNPLWISVGHLILNAYDNNNADALGLVSAVTAYLASNPDPGLSASYLDNPNSPSLWSAADIILLGGLNDAAINSAIDAYQATLDTQTSQSLGSIKMDALREGPSTFRYWAPTTGQGIRFDYRTTVSADALTYTYNTASTSLSLTGINIAGSATGLATDPNGTLVANFLTYYAADPVKSAYKWADNQAQIMSDPAVKYGTITGTLPWGFSGDFKIGTIGDADAGSFVGNQPATIDVATDAGGITTVNLSLPMSGTVRMENVQFGAQSFGPVAIDNIQFHRLNVKIGGL